MRGERREGYYHIRKVELATRWVGREDGFDCAERKMKK